MKKLLQLGQAARIEAFGNLAAGSSVMKRAKSEVSVCLNEEPFPDLYIVIKAGSDCCTHLLYAAKEAKRKKIIDCELLMMLISKKIKKKKKKAAKMLQCFIKCRERIKNGTFLLQKHLQFFI